MQLDPLNPVGRIVVDNPACGPVLTAHGLAYGALLLTTRQVFASGEAPAGGWIATWATAACWWRVCSRTWRSAAG